MNGDPEQSKPSEISVRSGDMIAGKYRIEREIGKGGMGVVFAAMHVELDQVVAIKVLRRSAAENPDFAARFVREARAAAKIRSEHVARVSDVGTLPDGSGYFVMEHLEGEDLAEVLRHRGALPVEEALDYILQACQAVAAAHAAGVVHRDLKPANLFLARQPDRSVVLKVLDFGVSKVVGSADGRPRPEPADGSVTRTGEVFGSPTYMSPEQLRGAGRVDTRADVWALGVVLHEMLAGQPPFWRGAFAEILAAVMRDPAPPLREARPEAPAEVEAAIARCLEKDPGRRFANVAQLARVLAPFSPSTSPAVLEKIDKLVGAAEVTADVSSQIPSDRQSSPSSGTRSRRVSLPSVDGDSRGSLSASSTTDRTAPIAEPPAPRRRAVAAIGLLIAGGALTLLLRGAMSASVAPATPQAPSATAAASAPSPPPSPSPVTAESAAPVASATPPATVALTVSSAPPGTRVFSGGVDVGAAPGPLRLARGAAPITLRFVAEGYLSTEVSVVPDADRTIAVTLARRPPPRVKPPKDLEPF